MFYLFVFSHYSCNWGGVRDFKGSFDSVENAKNALPSAVETLHDKLDYMAQIAVFNNGVITIVSELSFDSYRDDAPTWEDKSEFVCVSTHEIVFD
jgi:hypothetical protein